MNRDPGLQSEKHGLASWHPAHMPDRSNSATLLGEPNWQLESTNKGEHDEQLGKGNEGVEEALSTGKSVAADPLSNHDPNTLPPTPLQQDSLSPRYVPGIGLKTDSINGQAFRPPGIDSHSDSSSTKVGGGTQWEEDFSGHHGDLDTSMSTDFIDDWTQDSQKNNDAINGLSIFSPPVQETSITDSSHDLSAGGEHQGYTEVQNMEYSLGSHLQAEKLLPALGSLNRTNSFPAVPPLHQTQEVQDQAHARSQVESILEEDDHIGHAAEDGFDADAPEPNTNITDPDQGDPFSEVANAGESDFFNYANHADSGGNPFSPTDDEARFEEGLPLVPSETLTPEKEPSPIPLGLSTGVSNSHRSPPDEDFFCNDSEASQEESFFRPTALDRKSTNQVLDSMDYQPYTAIHDARAPQDNQTTLSDAAADPFRVSGDSMAPNSSAEPFQTMNGPEDEQASQKDEDLAALWQAALDDDELLDDIEAPAGQLHAPAAARPMTNSQASPLPNSKAVYGTDGRSQGLGGTTMDLTSTSLSSQTRYAPFPNQQTAVSPFYPSQTRTEHQPQSTSSHFLSHSSSAPAGFGQVAAQQPSQSSILGPSRPSMPKPIQSFADKSKGGYTSPYDLPMDVSRPKRRTNLQQLQTVLNPQTSSRPLAPPRSSSMYVSGTPADDLSPPLPPLPSKYFGLPAARPSSSELKPKPSMGSFFEELPSVKSRPPSSASRYAPTVTQQQSIQLSARSEPPRPTSLAQRPPSSSSNAIPAYQLIPPERQSPYATLSHPDNTTQAQVQTTSRYSPAPGSQSNIPPPRSRYTASPSTAPRPPASAPTLPFQPRTSSPLAQNATAPQQSHRTSSPISEIPVRPRVPQRAATTQRHDPHYYLPGLPQVEENFHPGVERIDSGIDVNASLLQSRYTHENLLSQPGLGLGPLQSSPSNSGFSALTPDSEQVSASPDLHVSHMNEQHNQSQPPSGDVNELPLRRPQTQSPGITRPKPDVLNRAKDVHQRPASATGGSSQGYAEPAASSHYAPRSQPRRNPTQDLNYIRPSDGREHDPLERWKGAPIFKFGFGGIVVTSFPKHIPRYAAGHGFPMIKCSPGEVRLQTGDRGTLEDVVTTFPGPLKSKSKKKELLEWLQKKIESLEKLQASVISSSTLPDPVKRQDEKVLLWKIVKVLVEYDGTVTRNSKAENAVRSILCPEIAEDKGTDASLVGSRGPLAGISKPEGSNPVTEPANPEAMESIRRLLLQGEREKAVWHAVDGRMWAHAMVLASTLDKSVWKQVLHEFTRLEVKPFGVNTESMAALYEVFAGNWEESIDELVPPSARAGLQMVSKAASSGPTRNALDGLDKWKETLTLILSNRTQDDENALVALSRLLAGYGRIEAAHLCLIFAKSTGLFGGTEDAQASVALLGADHQQQPFDYGRDLDSILLTEVYEFARSVLASSASLSVSPHLQSFKLYHAMLLAESGHRSEAQQYCDAIMSTLKSTTKPSPYYHTLLFMALDDLVERLQQAPRDGSSWMSKPMDKMSGSMWKRFNNFIVGDESDTGSISSGKGDQDSGPFAKVAADAANISHNASSTDLYSAFASQTGPPMPAPTAFGSRYAPSGQYTPRSSLEQQGRPSEEFQRPAQLSTQRPAQIQSPYPAQPSRYASSPAPRQDPASQQYKAIHHPSNYDSQKPESYLPTPPSQSEYMPTAPSDDPSSLLYPPEPLSKEGPSETQVSHNYTPDSDVQPSIPYEPPPSSTNGPGVSTYEPPSSYIPYDPEVQENENPTGQRSPKKKKSFMYDDDDDEFATRAAAVLKEDKSRKDREADEAFRKAAEADAQKDLKPKKSGWFGGVGGWLGGKKDDDLSSQEPKAIKAKLGEESSFYYDKELKKWVNKKGPAPAASEATKAPPPRGPPSRAVSGAGGPPPSPGRSIPPVPPLPQTERGTPPVNASQPMPLPQNLSHPPSGSGTPARTASPGMSIHEPAAASSGPPSAPPSRPSTAVGGGGGIDDLLGAPQARKGGTLKRAKKGRGYVDVMANGAK
ncbi:MAG: hypothetical protein Q9182_003521 [Xanthomendoza sp. 2 TL-2023]